MITAPTLFIELALEAGAAPKFGSDYPWNIPDPSERGGTFLRDDHGTIRKPGPYELWKFVKLAWGIYNMTGRGQETERAFMEGVARRAQLFYEQAARARIEAIRGLTKHLLKLDGIAFARLDDRLASEIGQAIARQEPRMAARDRHVAIATILRDYWNRPHQELSALVVSLQIERRQLETRIKQQSEALQRKLDLALAARRGLAPEMDRSVY